MVRKRRKYEERYLHGIFLGTLPAYQRQGLGRRVLRVVYDEARRCGYRGMFGVVNRDTPAFRFWLKEGHVVDGEFQVGAVTLYWMRFLF